MRRIFTTPTKITGDTLTHEAYNVGPATDYGMSTGAAVVMPLGGTATQYSSATGGLCLRLDLDNGDTVHVQHLKDRGAGRYPEGSTVARIAGYDDPHGSAWYGPHAHVYVIKDGVRMSMEEYYAALGYTPAAYGTIAQPTLTSASGGGTTPFGDEDDMLPMVILEPAGDPARYIYWPAGEDQSRYLATDKNKDDKQLAWDVYVANGYRNLPVQNKEMAERLVTRANRLWKARQK